MHDVVISDEYLKDVLCEFVAALLASAPAAPIRSPTPRARPRTTSRTPCSRSVTADAPVWFTWAGTRFGMVRATPAPRSRRRAFGPGGRRSCTTTFTCTAPRRAMRWRSCARRARGRATRRTRGSSLPLVLGPRVLEEGDRRAAAADRTVVLDDSVRPSCATSPSSRAPTRGPGTRPLHPLPARLPAPRPAGDREELADHRHRDAPRPRHLPRQPGGAR